MVNKAHAQLHTVNSGNFGQNASTGIILPIESSSAGADGADFAIGPIRQFAQSLQPCHPSYQLVPV
jgi:hypothetical protein